MSRSLDGIDPHPLHRSQVDDEPSVTDAVAGGMVSPAPHHDKQIVRASEVDGVHDIGNAGAASDERAAAMTSPWSHLHLVLMGGAISRVADDETAVCYRKAAYDCYILPHWTSPEEADRHIEWARATGSALQPFSAGGGYLNRHQSEDEGEVRRVYGPAKYERLAALKNKYDPANLFRVNHNIEPMAR